MKILDEAGIRLKLEKYKIAHSKTEWLGYHLSASGIKQIVEKIQAISDRLRPTTLKELQSLKHANIAIPRVRTINIYYGNGKQENYRNAPKIFKNQQ